MVGPIAANIGEDIGTGDPMRIAHAAGGALMLGRHARRSLATGSRRRRSPSCRKRSRSRARPKRRRVFRDDIRAGGACAENLATGATEHVQRAMPYLADELAQHPPGLERCSTRRRGDAGGDRQYRKQDRRARPTIPNRHDSQSAARRRSFKSCRKIRVATALDKGAQRAELRSVASINRRTLAQADNIRGLREQLKNRNACCHGE